MVESITKKNKEIDWILPLEGIVTSSCGSRKNPILDIWETHDGIDIAAQEGTEVKAATDGTISEVRTSETLGNVVTIENKSGYRIVYAHLKEALVAVGDIVSAGQVVALSGNTGLSTGPHLHCSVYYRNALIDPLTLFDLPYTEEVSAEYAAREEKIPVAAVANKNI